MQQFFIILSTCFLVVLGKTTFSPFIEKGNSSVLSPLLSSSYPYPSSLPPSSSFSSYPISSALSSSSSSSSSGGIPQPEPQAKPKPKKKKPSPQALALQSPQSLAQVQNDAVNYHSMSMADICASFTNGSHSEFYSPLYPRNYVNNTDCFKIISAGPGQVIRIKFLDHFHIEYEEHCDYDFLEIRDGQMGYSTLIEKICGTSPPTFIQSSGRHLWLRFHSDNDIEYIGFKAVYEFLPSKAFKPDLDECTMLNTYFEGNIGTENISTEVVANARAYEAPIDCTWMIQAEDHQKIYIVFEKYDLEKPNDCTYNYIEIYGSQTELTKDSRLKQYCGSKAEAVTSASNILYIRFFSMMDKKGAKDLKSRFHAYYSFFRDSSSVNPCNSESEHDCTDNTCIDKSLRCNDKNNCKLRNDEEGCPPRRPEEARYDIAVIALIGCVLILGMCGGLFLNIYRKLRQDRQELVELKDALGKSRESMLAMQIATGLLPTQQQPQQHGSSPHISSQDSGESKETVLERALPPAPNANINANGGTGTGSTQNITPKRSNGDVKKQLRLQAVQAEVVPNTIPYSPPPPYISASTNPNANMNMPLGTRLVGGPKNTSSTNNSSNNSSSSSKPIPVIPSNISSSSDIRKELPPTDKDRGREEKDRERDRDRDKLLKDKFINPTGEMCIEVRDSACQTRDSFLAQQRQLSYSPSSSSSIREPLKKAPLARTEAVELYDISPRRMMTRPTPPRSYNDDIPSYVSVSSTGTDRMGSLENIDEYHE